MREPPHSLEMEMAVLGAMMFDGIAVTEGLKRLVTEDFYRPSHQEIFKAMQALHTAGKPVSIEFLVEHLKTAKKLRDIGNEDYLVQVADFVPSPANIVYYCEQVIEKSEIRKFRDYATHLARVVDRGGDYDEVFAAAHKNGQFRKLTSSMEAEVFDDATFEPVEVSYLVEPYLPKGKCILLDGEGGVSKSTLTLAWAAALTSGRTPIANTLTEPVNVLYLHKGEDTSKELGTVFRGNGGDFKRMHFYREPIDFDPKGLAMVEDYIVSHGIGLVIVDALFYFLQGIMPDVYNALPAQAVMQRLQGVTERTQATFWNIRHTRKGEIGTKASELGMGSVQFRNSHRGQLLVRHHPTERFVAVVTDEKGSILTKRGEPFIYRREGLEVQYILNMANPFDSQSSAPPQKLGKVKDAEGLLKRLFSKASLYTREQIDEERKAENISYYALNSARESLGIESTKHGYSDGKYRWGFITRVNPYLEEGLDPFE